MLMFVLVFPGFTGVLAGSNLSGHLRTPTTSITRGSVWSLLFVLLTYSCIILALGGSVERAVRGAVGSSICIGNAIAHPVDRAVGDPIRRAVVRPVVATIEHSVGRAFGWPVFRSVVGAVDRSGSARIRRYSSSLRSSNLLSSLSRSTTRSSSHRRLNS